MYVIINEQFIYKESQYMTTYMNAFMKTMYIIIYIYMTNYDYV